MDREVKQNRSPVGALSGRRLFTTTLMAYLSLVAFYMTPIFMKLPILGGAGLGDVVTFFMLGALLGVAAFVAGLAMLSANGRYLAEKKPTGKVRMVVLGSVPLYIFILLGIPVIPIFFR